MPCADEFVDLVVYKDVALAVRKKENGDEAKVAFEVVSHSLGA